MKSVKAMSDPWLKDVYQLRAELGLPETEHPLFEGKFAPDLNLALFSSALMSRSQSGRQIQSQLDFRSSIRKTILRRTSTC